MYATDGNDRLKPAYDIPESNVGAPLPIVLASTGLVTLAYYVNVNKHSPIDIAIVRFVGSLAHMFGGPNDEALDGHPLGWKPGRVGGIRPHSAYEVENSSWIRILERMNSVHPMHKKSRYDSLRHFILTFRDETFECVATDFTVETRVGNLIDALNHILTNFA